MKAAAWLFALLLYPMAAFAQGSAVQFANNSTTLLTTNNFSGPDGPMSANGQFRIGLYVGPQGSPASSLTLVGLATNSTVLAGRFSGGNPFFLPAPYNTDQTIGFQIRAWSMNGGMSYEEAVAASFSNCDVYSGLSALGQVTLTTPPTPTPALFGTAAGQVGGFSLFPTLSCPEPGTYALAALGAAMLGLSFRKRRV